MNPFHDGPAMARDEEHAGGRRHHGPHGPHGQHGPHRHGGFGPGGFGGPFGGGPGGGRFRRGRRGGPFGGPGGPGGEDFGGFGPGGFGGRGPRGGGRGRGRRSRGDVRLAVLALLAEEPMHGYQIIQEIHERSGGAWRPSPGSIYPTVAQLADEGLVRTEKSDGRSVIHLTEAGQTYVTEHREELDAVWTTAAAAEDGFGSLREAGRGLAGAVKQVAQVGSAAQVAEAVRLLDDTRRRLYLLLAGETPTDGETDDTPDDGETT